MPRNTNVVAGRARRKKVLKAAKGYRGGHSRLFRNARETVNRARKYSFVGRKLKKRNYRSLWIVRLNAAVRAEGLTYSRFMNGLKKAQIDLDRKQLSELAIHQPEDFKKLVESARQQLTA